jgi:hypothetical protein
MSKILRDPISSFFIARKNKTRKIEKEKCPSSEEFLITTLDKKAHQTLTPT